MDRCSYYKSKCLYKVKPVLKPWQSGESVEPDLFPEVYWLKNWQLVGEEAEPWKLTWPVFESAPLTTEPYAVLLDAVLDQQGLEGSLQCRPGDLSLLAFWVL